jgi:hypothetical protein
MNIIISIYALENDTLFSRNVYIGFITYPSLSEFAGIKFQPEKL